MGKCLNCGVELLDPSRVCPLCQCIVEQQEELMGDVSYPHAEKKNKKMQKALNIYIFIAIVCEAILLFINKMLEGNHWWVFMIGILLVYTYITLKVSIEMDTGYRLKMMLQTYLGVFVLVALDWFLGFRMWSLHYVLPAAFVVMDITLMILMIVNSRNWQSYIPMQILVILMACVPVFLYRIHFLRQWQGAVIALAISVILFLGTVIMGGKRAREELFRRFHV